MCEEVGESLYQGDGSTTSLVVIDTKKPLSYQRLLMINWIFLVVFKRSLIYEFSLLTCYTSLHQPIGQSEMNRR
ncbi:hypothetical protein [Nostoc sp. 'Peltigera malacea cyanobiont' DB3992]|uniref:hypothetical protein n=1 Tax=Nostoc sp. 'Peltigera malacea cyanobiont' DB3992 TaxID=1206980 RepID=UPI00117C0CB4|nr:hypothetical protein [Nostoc sp. 'Peltigera malacea cyanobiont' DB3992]